MDSDDLDGDGGGLVKASITASQVRAARALLTWTGKQLADAARVGLSTVQRFESGDTSARFAQVERLKQALEAEGVVFVSPGAELEGQRLYDGVGMRAPGLPKSKGGPNA